MQKGVDNVYCPALPMGTKSGVLPGFLARLGHSSHRGKKAGKMKGHFPHHHVLNRTLEPLAIGCYMVLSILSQFLDL